MEKLELIYEGKGKKLYLTCQEDLLIAQFKDDLTAFNAAKKSSELGKGELNCAITTQIFKKLEKEVPTHYVKTISPEEILCKKVDIIPLEVVVRNTATGSLSKRLGIKEGISLKSTPLNSPLVEFYYKDDSLNDPLVCRTHCLMMGIASLEELDILASKALKVNEILIDYFKQARLDLIDFKLEFGKDSKGEILLADEISPDSCRLWDADTKQKMDKDIFRQDLGNIKVAYEEVLRRLLLIDMK